MIDQIVEKTRDIHKSVFMAFKTQALGGAHSEIITPTYERKKHKLKDENEITHAAYFDLVRRKMNDALSKKAKNITHGVAISAVVFACFVIAKMWVAHPPFSKPIKDRIFENETLNSITERAPEGLRDKISAGVSKWNARSAENSAQRQAKEKQAAEENSNKAEAWRNAL